MKMKILAPITDLPASTRDRGISEEMIKILEGLKGVTKDQFLPIQLENMADAKSMAARLRGNKAMVNKKIRQMGTTVYIGLKNE